MSEQKFKVVRRTTSGIRTTWVLVVLTGLSLEEAVREMQALNKHSRDERAVYEVEEDRA